MVRRTAIAIIGFLMLLSLALPLSSQAQNTGSTASQSSTGGHHHAGARMRRMRHKMRSMRRKMRSMQPRIQRREAKRQANGTGGTTNATPNNVAPTQTSR